MLPAAAKGNHLLAAMPPVLIDWLFASVQLLVIFHLSLTRNSATDIGVLQSKKRAKRPQNALVERQKSRVDTTLVPLASAIS